MYKNTFIVLLFSLLICCKKSSKKNTNALKKLEITKEKEVSIKGLLYESNWDGVINEGDYEEVVGTYTLNKGNEESKALSLDGLSEYVRIENHKNINPDSALTLSIWYKPISFKGSGNDAIVLKSSIPKDSLPFYQYYIGVTGNEYPSPKYKGSFQFALGINGICNILRTKPDTWQPSKWYNIVATYSSNVMKLYLNGRLINSKTIKVINNPFNIYNSDLFIGKKTQNSKTGTPGNFDNLKIYNRALSEKEILKLYSIF